MGEAFIKQVLVFYSSAAYLLGGGGRGRVVVPPHCPHKPCPQALACERARLHVCPHCDTFFLLPSTHTQGGKTKILFPIYFEQERPPTAGVADGVIEKEQYLTDVQRFPRDKPLPHQFTDDSPWYLIQPGQG